MQLPVLEEELLFRILFLISYAVFAGVRFYYRGKTIGRESERDYTEMNKSMIVLSIGILGYLSLVVIYVILPDLIFWAHIALPFVVRACGVIIAFVGIGLTFLTHRTLGKQYSAKQEIQKEHELIAVGIYNHIRHPMYTSMNVFSLAVSLIAANLLLIIFAIIVALPFPWLARREEEMLIDRFGDDYREYMKRTGRFFPPIRRRK